MKNLKSMKLPYTGKEVLLSIQHLFAMFGATVLVPLLTGFSPAVALVTAGIGTLAFHLLTKCKVPVFLGSSFAFIGSLSTIVQTEGIPFAQGGIIIAGCIYCLMSIIVYFVGADVIKKILPAEVTGPIIIVIAMGLASVAINHAFNASTAPGVFVFDPIMMAIALFTFVVIIAGMIFARGFFKIVPILIGLVCGYALSAILAACGVFTMNYDAIIEAPWFNIPYVTEGFFSLPKFSGTAIFAIAPIALVSFMEHIGDITTNGMVVEKDFFKDPGLHRTVLGDGVATLIAGFLGGPANTTYSENTGVLATTKNYNPKLLRLTAVFAIILGFIGKFGAILQTIPSPVMGGIEIILFGMIAAVGIRTLAESKLDFTNSRNLIIVGTILVIGIGLSAVGGIKIGGSFVLSGLFVATIVGILMNLILPRKLDKATKGTENVDEIQKDFGEFDIFAAIAKLFRKVFKISEKKCKNDAETLENYDIIINEDGEIIEPTNTDTIESAEVNTITDEESTKADDTTDEVVIEDIVK